MGYGTNDKAVTTNDLLVEYSRGLELRIEEADPFSPFFKKVDKPAGIDSRMNFVIDTTADAMDRQAPLTHRVGHKRTGYEIDVFIPDKERYSSPVSWEKIRKGRFDEAQAAVYNAQQAIVRERATNMGDVLLTNAITSSDPTDPSAASNGETAYWWNSNDTTAPPNYGSNTFSAGHDHVETGVTALTLDRIRTYLNHITEHGYGSQGFVMMVSNQENSTLLNLGNVAQQSRTTGVGLTDAFQKAGRASEVNGLMGLEIIVSQWVPADVVGVWDRNLASLGVNGGAVKVVDQDVQTSRTDDEDIQATWFDAWYQEGYGILHKGAGYTALVAA